MKFLSLITPSFFSLDRNGLKAIEKRVDSDYLFNLAWGKTSAQMNRAAFQVGKEIEQQTAHIRKKE